jgi:hypothetical protein
MDCSVCPRPTKRVITPLARAWLSILPGSISAAAARDADIGVISTVRRAAAAPMRTAGRTGTAATLRCHKTSPRRPWRAGVPAISSESATAARVLFERSAIAAQPAAAAISAKDIVLRPAAAAANGRILRKRDVVRLKRTLVVDRAA